MCHESMSRMPEDKGILLDHQRNPAGITLANCLTLSTDGRLFLLCCSVLPSSTALAVLYHHPDRFSKENGAFPAGLVWFTVLRGHVSVSFVCLFEIIPGKSLSSTSQECFFMQERGGECALFRAKVKRIIQWNTSSLFLTQFYPLQPSHVACHVEQCCVIEHSHYWHSARAHIGRV